MGRLLTSLLFLLSPLLLPSINCQLCISAKVSAWSDGEIRIACDFVFISELIIYNTCIIFEKKKFKGAILLAKSN